MGHLSDRASAEGGKNVSRPSWSHMGNTVNTSPGRKTTREILEQIVRGARGRQLRAKVAGLNSDVDRSRVDDAFQTACERAGKPCRGKTEGEVFQFLYTTMMRELTAVRTALQREEPVDWSSESLARFRRCDTSVAEEVVDREAEDELVELSLRVLDELTERQRAVPSCTATDSSASRSQRSSTSRRGSSSGRSSSC